MQGSDLWRPIAIAESTAETGVTLSDNMSALHVLGLMWNASPTAACATEPVAQMQFDTNTAQTAAAIGHLTMHPPVPSMPQQMPTPSIPVSPMHIPAMTSVLESCDVSQLLAIAMPGPLGGLSNSQIEEQLRAAAAQIEVYDD
jgi:hypothetical protein